MAGDDPTKLGPPITKVAEMGPVPPFIGDIVSEFLLRDYFAAQAMRALVGVVSVPDSTIPERAYTVADKMIAYRKMLK